ncbi:MAG: phosphatase PAP2 family protein [Patescibacteria group bacterium]|nr:MAG: phosphatase PAP2 family protein [Patescibacteria group bacterium]
MFNLLLNIDQSVTLFFYKLFSHNVFFDIFFSFFSFLGSTVFVWLIIIFLVVFFEEKAHPGISKNDKKFIVIFTLTIFLSFLTSEVILKNIFQRPRPFSQIKNLKLKIKNYPSDFSFPSGHATIAFATATTLSFFDKKRKWFYYFLASLIAYSRLYLGVHYFFDVVIGGIIGTMISRIILKKLKT